MEYQARSIRAFIGAKKIDEFRIFYQELGFEEDILSSEMSRFKVNENLSFYLQDYYIKKWCNNSMIFLEVDDVDLCWSTLYGKKLQEQYKYVRFTEIKEYEWGREFFMHDPSGILWHFGQFNN